ncbi:MAG TPA: hypothetical protein VMR14_01115 [Streptosporangiaceae bacterium]|nr:hypothetical protein [Streptosporangiaceae bacterium]
MDHGVLPGGRRRRGHDHGIGRVAPLAVVAVLGPRVHRYLVRPSRAAPRPFALGALQEMTSPQVRVPGSIAIVGYDDIDFAAATAGGSGGSAPRASTAVPRQAVP